MVSKPPAMPFVSSVWLPLSLLILLHCPLSSCDLGEIFFLSNPSGPLNWGNVDYFTVLDCGCIRGETGGSYLKDCDTMNILYYPETTDCSGECFFPEQFWFNPMLGEVIDCSLDGIHCHLNTMEDNFVNFGAPQGWVGVLEYPEIDCTPSETIFTHVLPTDQCTTFYNTYGGYDMFPTNDTVEIFDSSNGLCPGPSLLATFDNLVCDENETSREFIFGGPGGPSPTMMLPPVHTPSTQTVPEGVECNGLQSSFFLSSDLFDGDGDGDSSVGLIAGSVLGGAILICCFVVIVIIGIIVVILVIFATIGITAGPVFTAVMGSGDHGGGSSMVGDDMSLSDMSDADVFAKGVGGNKSNLNLALHATHMIVPYDELTIINPPIGQGAFGVVNRGLYNETEVAVKTLVRDAYEDNTEEFLKEVECLTTLHHPNIVLFIGACDNPPAIITEFVERGSLYDLIHSTPDKLTHPRALKIIMGMAKGMAYLHKQTPPMIHRDLKSGNILITRGYEAKICDFGISKRDESTNNMTKKAGTTRWTAPEVLDGPERYTSKADVYSFAIIAWEMFAKDLPFASFRFDHQIEEAVLEGERPDLPESLPGGIEDLIEDCWEGNPDDRPSFLQIVRRMKRAEQRSSAIKAKKKKEKKAKIKKEKTNKERNKQGKGKEPYTSTEENVVEESSTPPSSMSEESVDETSTEEESSSSSSSSSSYVSSSDDQ